MNQKVVIVVAIALCAVAFSCTRNPDKEGTVRAGLPLQQLRDGDLLFRCGMSLESHAVVEADKSEGVYSHVGIAISDGGMWKVVHAVPGESLDGVDRVKVESVDTFFLTTRAVRGSVMRLRGCDIARAHDAAQWALSKVGVEFDHHYNWEDSSRLYCTELIQRAYQSVGINISQDRKTHVSLPFFNGDVVFPSDIERNDSLKEIFSF